LSERCKEKKDENEEKEKEEDNKEKMYEEKKNEYEENEEEKKEKEADEEKNETNNGYERNEEEEKEEVDGKRDEINNEYEKKEDGEKGEMSKTGEEKENEGERNEGRVVLNGKGVDIEEFSDKESEINNQGEVKENIYFQINFQDLKRIKELADTGCGKDEDGAVDMPISCCSSPPYEEVYLQNDNIKDEKIVINQREGLIHHRRSLSLESDDTNYSQISLSVTSEEEDDDDKLGGVSEKSSISSGGTNSQESICDGSCENNMKNNEDVFGSSEWRGNGESQETMNGNNQLSNSFTSSCSQFNKSLEVLEATASMNKNNEDKTDENILEKDNLNDGFLLPDEHSVLVNENLGKDVSTPTSLLSHISSEKPPSSTMKRLPLTPPWKAGGESLRVPSAALPPLAPKKPVSTLKITTPFISPAKTQQTDSIKLNSDKTDLNLIPSTLPLSPQPTVLSVSSSSPKSKEKSKLKISVYIFQPKSKNYFFSSKFHSSNPLQNSFFTDNSKSFTTNLPIFFSLIFIQFPF
jgi:hypothetical protein